MVMRPSAGTVSGGTLHDRTAGPVVSEAPGPEGYRSTVVTAQPGVLHPLLPHCGRALARGHGGSRVTALPPVLYDLLLLQRHHPGAGSVMPSRLSPGCVIMALHALKSKSKPWTVLQRLFYWELNSDSGN
eukprot:427634-Hanusia_phi.AAC.1